MTRTHLADVHARALFQTVTTVLVRSLGWKDIATHIMISTEAEMFLVRCVQKHSFRVEDWRITLCLAIHDKCTYVTGYRGSLARHFRRMHERTEQPLDKKFKCEFCDYCANRKCHFALHVKTVRTEQREFQCDHPGCNYKTNNSYVFRMQTGQHENDQQKRFPVLCTIPDCDHRAGTQDQVKVRERSYHHNPQARFRCKSCPQIYSDRASCYFHSQQVHAVKPCHSWSERSAGVDKTAVVILQRIYLELIWAYCLFVFVTNPMNKPSRLIHVL